MVLGEYWYLGDRPLPLSFTFITDDQSSSSLLPCEGPTWDQSPRLASCSGSCLGIPSASGAGTDCHVAELASPGMGWSGGHKNRKETVLMICTPVGVTMAQRRSALPFRTFRLADLAHCAL